MNLLSLILVAMALIVAGCVFYVAWQFSSGEFETERAREGAQREMKRKEPGDSKESQDPPGP